MTAKMKRWQWLLLGLGLVVRIAFSLSLSKDSALALLDGREYYAYAQSLFALQGDNYARYFVTIRPPLYSLFLVPFIAVTTAIWPIQLAQSVLGVYQAVILRKLASSWLGERAGKIALVLALFHPFLIYYCGYVLTETLFITLLWAGMYCLWRFSQSKAEHRTRWIVTSAVLFGLGCLTRPTLQPFLAVIAVWMAWYSLRTMRHPRALIPLISFTLIVSAILLPVLIRNYRVRGDFSLSPQGQQTMRAMGNSPDYLLLYETTSKTEYYKILDRLNVKMSLLHGAETTSIVDESRDFRANRQEDWWRLQAYKFVHFWTPWLDPMIFSRPLFLLSAVCATPLFVFAGIELWRKRKEKDAFLLLVIGLVSVGYLVGGFLFHVQVRYRIPFVDVAFLLLSSSLLAKVSVTRFLKQAIIKFNAAFWYG